MTATNRAIAGMIRRKRMLELFSGTGSVGNVFRERGWDVTSLDRDMQADIKADILSGTTGSSRQDTSTSSGPRLLAPSIARRRPWVSVR